MTPVTDKVVIGFDGSWHSRPALSRAVEAALERRLPLTVLTVVPTVFDPGLSGRDHGVAAQARLERATAEAVDAAADVRAREPSLVVSVEVVLATEGDRLQQHLAQCRLLVLGDRGASGSRAFLLGTTSRELIRATSCPVLVVPDEPRPGIPGDLVDVDPATLAGAVLVGLGAGADGVEVLRVAAAEAARSGARLVVLHSYSTSVEAEGAQRLSKARELVERRLRDARLEEGLHVRTILTPRPPADSLLLHGRLARLLVIGSRGSMALARLAMGSVSRGVLDATSTPVLVIPARGV